MGVQVNLRELLAKVPAADTAQLLKSYFLEHDPDPQLWSALEPLQTPEEIVRFLREQMEQLQSDYQRAEEGRLSAMAAKRMFESAATEVNDLRNASVQQFRDFTLYLARYLNDELNIPPEIPAELDPFGEFLLSEIGELRQKAQRPLAEGTQKVVFMEGESPLERLTEMIYRAVESDDPLATFRRYRGELPTLPEEHRQRLASLELFLTEYGHKKTLWEERREQLEKARETAGEVAEENERLQLRIKELQEGRPANGWEPQGYQPLVDGAIEAENARLRGEVQRLTGEQGTATAQTEKLSALLRKQTQRRAVLVEEYSDFVGQLVQLGKEKKRRAERYTRLSRQYGDALQAKEASERKTAEAEGRYRDAQEWAVGLQTEIATTRGGLGAVREYSERLKQFLRRGAQRLRESTNNLREEQRLSAGLQERVEELTREAERESGQSATVRQERDDAQQQVVDLTRQLGERTGEYQNADRQRRLSEAEGRRLRETYQTTVQEGERLYRQIDELTAQLRVAREEIGKYSGTDAEKTARITELEAQREELHSLRERLPGLERRVEELQTEARTARTTLVEKDAELGSVQGRISNLESLRRDRIEEYSRLEREYRALQEQLQQTSQDLHQREKEIVGLTTDLGTRTAEYQNEQRQRRLAEQQVGELQLNQELAEGLQDYVKEVTTERDSAQAELCLTKREYRRAGQRLHVQRQLSHSTQEQVAELTTDVEKLKVELRSVQQHAGTERERLRGEIVQAKKDYAAELAAHYETNVAGFTRTLSELTEERDKIGQRLHIQRQIGRSVQGRLTTEVEELRRAGRYSQKELEEAERVRAENECTVTGLERTLEETTTRLEAANRQLGIYEQRGRETRRLTESLVATVSQPGREPSPLVVEVVEEPEGVSPAVTEPVLPEMILSVEPVTPPLEQPVPSIQRTRTYYPRNILRGLAQAGALVGAMVAASMATYYAYDALTSPPAVQPVTIPMQIPIQNAADLLRYKSALESAYLEGIHHREGRDAILHRLQETAQRHPLQNDALQPEYEGQLTHMRRIVGITHK